MKISEMTVSLIDKMGTDLSVVNAARVSFEKTSEYEVNPETNVERLKESDCKLINYLAKHEHFTPFCHAFLSFRIKAPIFVARQLVKHQVGLSWNEVSRRYVDSEPEFYIPPLWRKRATNVKQGSSKEDFGRLQKTGKCLYCGVELIGKRLKYCIDSHQVYHSQQRLPYNTKFSRWKATAKANNIIWDIELDDLDWPEFCPYLNVKLNYNSDNLADNVASLDKIIPEHGYVKGNVQIISNLANKMKSSANKEQLLLFSKNVALLHGGIFINSSSSYETFLEESSKTYNRLIQEGLAPEQARIFMPQSMFTEWIWSGSLLAFIRVCKLRCDGHAQEETRFIGNEIKKHLMEHFPNATKAYLE